MSAVAGVPRSIQFVRQTPIILEGIADSSRSELMVVDSLDTMTCPEGGTFPFVTRAKGL